MKKTLSILPLLLIVFLGTAQNLQQQWATGYKAQGDNSDKFNALARDGSGNIYAVGYTMRQGNGKDFLVVKFNANGDTVWTRTYDGTGNGNDELNSVVLDKSGDVIVCGTLKSQFGKDLAVAKYSSAGALSWLRNYNGHLDLDDYGVKAVCDTAGNVYAAGYAYNPSLNYDYVIIKYSAPGAQQWVKTWNGADDLDDELSDIGIDALANITVTGKSKTVSNKDDYATVKYASDGTLVWEKTLDQGANNDRATAIVVEAGGNVYVTGRSDNGNNDDYVTIKYSSADGSTAWGPKTYNSGNGDDHALAMAANSTTVVVTGTVYNGVHKDIRTIGYATNDGTQQWSKLYSGIANKDDEPTHVAIDATGNVVVTGIVDRGTTTKNNDLFILCYESAGNQWDEIIGGNASLSDNGSMSAFDASGNVYTVGALVSNSGMKDGALLKHDASGLLQWQREYNGEGEFTEKGIAMAVINGVLYATGYGYNYDVDRDIVTIKYDGAGNKVWVKTYNGPDDDTDEPVAIAGDASGNIYVAGRSKNVNNDYDYVVIKYNSNGDTIWTRRYDGGLLGDDEPRDMKVDAAGNIYITGESDADPSVLSKTDMVTVKYTSAGALDWTAPYNGSGDGDDRGYSLAVDNSGHVFATGRTWKGSDYDIVTFRYNSTTANEDWATPYTSATGDDAPVKMLLDASGNLIIGAKSDRDATSAENLDYLIIKLNSAGAQQWAQFYNGTGNGADDLNDLAVDGSGNIYASGSSDAHTDSTESLDYATVKLDAAGNQKWAERYNSSVDDDDIGYGVAVSANGTVYVTGQSDEIGVGKNYNAVTIVYSDSGALLQQVSYDVIGETDEGSALLLDNNSLYVTGWATFAAADQKDLLTIKYDIPTGIDELENAADVFVYPNPVSRDGVMIIDGAQAGERVQMIDLLGKVVADIFVESNHVNLKPMQLAAGLYLLRLTNRNSTVQTKITIQ